MSNPIYLNLGPPPEEKPPQVAPQGDGGHILRFQAVKGQEKVVLLQFQQANAEVAEYMPSNSGGKYKVLEEGYSADRKRVIAVAMEEAAAATLRSASTVTVLQAGTQEFDETVKSVRVGNPNFLKSYLGS